MDNRHISIQSAGRPAFNLAIKLFFTSEYDRDSEPTAKATHYFESSDGVLVFLWHDDSSHNAQKLPIPLSWEGVANLAWEWLVNQPTTNYGEKLDHDGSNSKGFRAFNENWGHVKGSHYGIVGIKPIWAWHGK